ncbi:MAG: LytTR family DNA-binding domain-containing protein [Bacteroidota bacterium]
MRIFINLSTIVQLLISLLLGLWVYIFLAFIGPFDIAPLQLSWRLQVMSIYGLLFSLSYIAIIPIQKMIWEQQHSWTLTWEVLILLLVFLICWPLSYAYYTSEWIQGEFSFYPYTFELYVPCCLILFPVAFGMRRIRFRRSDSPQEQPLVIEGTNKLDFLQVNRKDLLAVKSAGNYVEVYFHQAGKVQKKLIRTTLKEINASIPELQQVHRSYLINLTQPMVWQDKQMILLSSLEIPVSHSFRKELIDTLKARH